VLHPLLVPRRAGTLEERRANGVPSDVVE
jgi:hypothetical protein